MKVVVFFSILSSAPTFLSCPVSHINNSSKTLVNLTKFTTEKHTSCNWYKVIRKSDKTHLLKRIFLHFEKDQTKYFSPFYVKELLTTGKNS